MLEGVSAFAQWPLGRDLLLSLRPKASYPWIVRRLQEVSQATAVLQEEGEPFSLEGVPDILPYLEMVRPKGSSIPKQGAWEVLLFLEELTALKTRWQEKERFSLISGWIKGLRPLEGLMESLRSIFDSSGEIRDEASSGLWEVRSRLNLTRREIMGSLQRLLAKPQLQSHFRDRSITIKNGRYVIPVKSGSVHRIGGVVQDHSASGETAFLEPQQVVHLNNRLVSLEREEKREIERILLGAAERIRSHLGSLKKNRQILGHLDLTFAKARWALKWEANVPAVVQKGALSIQKGYHPLLLLQKGKDRTVPLDLTLGKGFTTLVITGPNTGGKTVALKTVGLLALMVQSGLPVPVSEDSQFKIFTNIWSDIGDEQNIEQNLSTFSAHISRIKEMVEKAAPPGLVLIDEIGAGTDPAEGAPLAMAIIDELHSRGVWVMVTSHHDSLKAFARMRRGMENASVAFDVETLQPLYRLEIGVPGRSNAFAIAQRLGMPRRVIEKAMRWKGKREKEADRFIRELEREIKRVKSQQERLKKDEERLRRRIAQEEERLRKRREEIEGLWEEELRRLTELKEEIREARRSLSDHRKLDRLQREVADRVKETGKRRPISFTSQPIRIGDVVKIKGTSKEGPVVWLSSKKARVEAGGFLIEVPIEELELVRKGDASKAPDSPQDVLFRPAKVKAPPYEINLIGQRVDDALALLDRQIHDAYLAGRESIRVVHGVGQGILKSAVREALQEHPLVSRIEDLPGSEGGAGATLAVLKED